MVTVRLSQDLYQAIWIKYGSQLTWLILPYTVAGHWPLPHAALFLLLDTTLRHTDKAEYSAISGLESISSRLALQTFSLWMVPFFLCTNRHKYVSFLLLIFQNHPIVQLTYGILVFPFKMGCLLNSPSFPDILSVLVRTPLVARKQTGLSKKRQTLPHIIAYFM